MRRRFTIHKINKDFAFNNYLTIEACETGLTASLSSNACEYCVDGNGNWKTLSAGTATESINNGQTLSFRGNLTPMGPNGIGTFTINKKCKLKGNCMSMIFSDNAADNYSLIDGRHDLVFACLFRDCSNIVNVSSNFLPATTISYGCYRNMFQNCTSLTTAPELPATTLANYCYSYMFSGCTNLTTAPELPATTLASYCYYNMFNGTDILPDCSNIDFASSTVVSSGGLRGLFSGTKVTDNYLERLLPKNNNGRYYLPATTLTSSCYISMFEGCTNLTTAPELPATTLTSSCYRSMFQGCTSLTTAPELPATTLTSSCYSSMFKGCTNLTTAPELPATTLDAYCYKYMFTNCAHLTTAPALPATTLTNYCYQNMFQGCTSLTTAPELPATMLKKKCYQYMFQNCIKLRYIKMLATNISASDCLYNWVNGVSSTGTFVKNTAMTSLPRGTSGIPTGWTVQNV